MSGSSISAVTLSKSPTEAAAKSSLPEVKAWAACRPERKHQSAHTGEDARRLPFTVEMARWPPRASLGFGVNAFCEWVRVRVRVRMVVMMVMVGA